MFYKWIAVSFIVFLMPFSLYSQVRPDFDEDIEEEEVIEIKEIDSKLKSWTLSGNGVFIEEFEIDTIQDEFHIYNPIYKNSITNTYVGNYGGAYLNNDFFSRQYNTDFYFLKTHDAYLLTPHNLNYYNTTTPYTLLDYSQSENKNVRNETRFNVLHSRNINPNFNVTFRFDQARSDGQYTGQVNKNNFVTLYSSYNSDKVNFHGGFILNSINNQENGGMKDDSQLFEDLILFNLLETRSAYKSNYFFTTTEYKKGKYNTETDDEGNETKTFIPRIGFMHYFEYSNNLRQFWEEDVNFDFFPKTYLDSISTNDSVRFNKVTNLLQVRQFEAADKKVSFGKRAYVGFDIVKASYNGYGEEISNINNYSNIYIGGGIFKTLGKFWNWDFNGRLYITGYRSGQTEISGIISKPIILFKDTLVKMEITGKLENLVPDYFQHQYNSNHMVWFNSFNNEQRMTAGFKIKSPKRKLEMGVNYALINNFIYNDTLVMPVQTKKELLIMSAFLNKNIQLGKFFINTKLLAQKASSEELIHLPEFSAYMGVYYKLLISKVLFAQIGVDTRYNTKYYADSYDPSTGLFYLQNDKKIGNYPYIDAYASLKLKRTRVFFKLINVGSNFINDEFFTALHYPMNRMTFRLGVDWKFLD